MLPGSSDSSAHLACTMNCLMSCLGLAILTLNTSKLSPLLYHILHIKHFLKIHSWHVFCQWILQKGWFCNRNWSHCPVWRQHFRKSSFLSTPDWTAVPGSGRLHTVTKGTTILGSPPHPSTQGWWGQHFLAKDTWVFGFSPQEKHLKSLKNVELHRMTLTLFGWELGLLWVLIKGFHAYWSSKH